MKLVYGVGINDLKGESQTKIYKIWSGMLKRCYSDKLHKKRPSYIGCSVCDEWLLFSKFKTWAVTQDFDNKELDKDILISGNKVYSPNTCVFVSQELNSFMIESDSIRGEYPIGVCLYKPTNKYKSYCNVKGKSIHLGYFDTPEEAHKVWKAKKLEMAYIHASKQSDVRIAKSIIEKYK